MLRSLPNDKIAASAERPVQAFDSGYADSSLRVARSGLLLQGGRDWQDVGASTLANSDRHFLFVTAPFGALSAELGRRLRSEGARATRILLCAGDLLDWGVQHAASYRGDLAGWTGWIEAHLGRQGVTDLVVFGDAHPYVIAAMAVARAAGINIHVLEEGYFRPHWITLERDGVNGSSSLPKDPNVYRREAATYLNQEFVPVGKITPSAVTRISAYHTVQYLGLPIFPHYRTPNPYTPLQQAIGHTHSYARQRLNAKRCEAGLHGVIAVSGPIFLALLQRPGDSQLLRNSNLRTVAAFIEKVVGSFASHAPPEMRLLFKAHPLDHGIEAHHLSIKRYAEQWGVADRVFYTDGGHFPSLVRASVGVLSVNSTGGLTAIEFQRPTMVLGSAIYNMPGLTHQSGMDQFWSSPESPDPSLFQAFRRVVMGRTQINGAYSTSHGVRLAAPEVTRRLLGG